MLHGNGYVVICTLEPEPLPCVSISKCFTRLDYSARHGVHDRLRHRDPQALSLTISVDLNLKAIMCGVYGATRCTLSDVLEGLARTLRVSSGSLDLKSQDGSNVELEQSLRDYSDHRSRDLASPGEGQWKDREQRVKSFRTEIRFKVRQKAVGTHVISCTVQGGEGKQALGPVTVQLQNTATMGELLIRARTRRRGAFIREGPVYGRPGELERTLSDAWVLDGCSVDGTLHVGQSVVATFAGQSGNATPLLMGQKDTIGNVKQKMYEIHGIASVWQVMMVRGTAQQLDDDQMVAECLPAAGELGGATTVGWGELHLEVLVKCPALQIGSRPRGHPGARTNAAEQASHFINLQFGRQSPERGNRSSSAWHRYSPPNAGADHAAEPKTTAEVMPGRQSPSALGARFAQVGRRPCASTIIFFALSPSGRALTLVLPRTAVVLDAKEHIAAKEEVHPCNQRLFWRGLPLEPNDACLYALGVRGGDTLMLGYRAAQNIGTTPNSPFDVQSVIDDGLLGVTDAEGFTCADSCDKPSGSHGHSSMQNRETSRDDEDVSSRRTAGIPASDSQVNAAGDMPCEDISPLTPSCDAETNDARCGERCWWSKRRPNCGSGGRCGRESLSFARQSGGSLTSPQVPLITRWVLPTPSAPTREAAGRLAESLPDRDRMNRTRGRGNEAEAPRERRQKLNIWRQWKCIRRMAASSVSMSHVSSGG